MELNTLIDICHDCDEFEIQHSNGKIMDFDPKILLEYLNTSDYSQEYSNFRPKDCIVFKSKIENSSLSRTITHLSLNRYCGYGRCEEFKINSTYFYGKLFIIHDFELFYQEKYDEDNGYTAFKSFLKDPPLTLSKNMDHKFLINQLIGTFNCSKLEKPDWLKNLEIL